MTEVTERPDGWGLTFGPKCVRQAMGFLEMTTNDNKAGP